MAKLYDGNDRDEKYALIYSRNYFKRWLRAGGWKSIEEFEEMFDVTWEQIQGTPFFVAGERLYLKPIPFEKEMRNPNFDPKLRVHPMYNPRYIGDPMTGKLYGTLKC